MSSADQEKDRYNVQDGERVASPVSGGSSNTGSSAPGTPLSRSSRAAARLLQQRQKNGSRSRARALQNKKSEDEFSLTSSAATVPTGSLSRNVQRKFKQQQQQQQNNMSPVSSVSPPASPKADISAPSSPRSPTASSNSMAVSAESRRAIRNRGRRHRVAGGAAAKLMLQGPKKQPDEVSPDQRDKYATLEASSKDDDDDDVVSAGSSELDEIREKAKKEFELGPEDNTRYKPPLAVKTLKLDIPTSTGTAGDGASEVSVPSILNRSEAFHENATSAILALLTPAGGNAAASDAGSVASGGDAASRCSSVPPPAKTAFESPRRGRDGGDPKSAPSPKTVDPSFEYTSKTPAKPLLPLSAEKILENLKTDMVDPSKTLGELLAAIASPEEGQPMDRGYMVRRKNACGALKVLTSNAANRKTICWTVGVLSALTAVLQDTGEQGAVVSFPDVHTRREYEEARNRAVASLLNLCTPKENRIPIFHCPGLVRAVKNVILDDKGESRQGCTAILAYLAKTPENRLLLVEVPGLIDSVDTVIKPDVSAVVVLPKKEPRQFVWESYSEEDTTLSPDRGIDSLSTFESGGFTTSYSYEQSTLSPTDADATATNDDDSDRTPLTTTSPTSLASKVAVVYDRDPNKYIHTSRQYVFAMLLHLLKEKENAYKLARNSGLVSTMVEISNLHDSPCHVHALRVIAHMTRHRDNSKLITFKYRIIVPALVHATHSEDLEARKHACFALQNLTQDKSCRQEAANTKDLLSSLCARVRHSTDKDERLAAVSALKNLTDEPANLIPLTNTPECFATLMQIAHGKDEHMTEMMQYLACDAIATLSHWLRKIATSGYTLDAKKQGLPAPPGMIAPSFKVITYCQFA